MTVPRDTWCWYCKRGEHARCPSPETCACWECMSREATAPVRYPTQACSLAPGVRSVNEHDALVDVVRRCEALLTRQGWMVPAVPAEALAPEQQLLHDASAVLRRVAEGAEDGRS